MEKAVWAVGPDGPVNAATAEPQHMLNKRSASGGVHATGNEASERPISSGNLFFNVTADQREADPLAKDSSMTTFGTNSLPSMLFDAALGNSENSARAGLTSATVSASHSSAQQDKPSSVYYSVGSMLANVHSMADSINAVEAMPLDVLDFELAAAEKRLALLKKQQEILNVRREIDADFAEMRSAEQRLLRVQ